MKLYHFTAGRFLEKVKHEGLTLGCFPLLINGQVALRPNTQWLTKNPSFEQPWHDPESTQLKYDRREYRITVSIPKSYRVNLLDWGEIKRKLGHVFIPDFDWHQDHINWYIFIGQIKPNWFREIKRKEE